MLVDEKNANFNCNSFIIQTCYCASIVNYLHIHSYGILNYTIFHVGTEVYASFIYIDKRVKLASKT